MHKVKKDKMVLVHCECEEREGWYDNTSEDQ